MNTVMSCSHENVLFSVDKVCGMDLPVNIYDFLPFHNSWPWEGERGGGGHCLLKGSYPLPNDHPCFSGLSALEFSLTTSLVFRLADNRPLTSYFLYFWGCRSCFLATKSYTKMTPILPQTIPLINIMYLSK